jgi:VanZ family protein
MLIVYASWYPLSGWRTLGVPPFAFLNLSMPRYWTLFDVLTNIVGYLPLGTLMVFALYPRVRGLAAVALTVALGALLSGTMETVQNYLPSRVPSSLDLMTNIGGTALGAILGAVAARPLLEHSQLHRLRQRWFLAETSFGLIVTALWPLAQIYPQGYLFGHGQLLPILSEWLSNWLDAPVDLAAFMRNGVDPTVQQYWLTETIITACGLTGALLTMLCVLRKSAPRGWLVLIVIGSAIIVKSLASALLFAPENAFVWLTPGAEGGFLIGLLMLSGLAFARPVAQRRLAVLCLLLSLLAVNAIPANPYFIATLQSWVQGKFLNFNGAAQFLSLLWPFFALWFLWHPAHSLNRK